MWVLGFLILLVQTAYADIGIVFQDTKRAVIYLEEKTRKVRFVYCARETEGSDLNRNCPKASGDYSKNYGDYLLAVQELYRIDKRYRGASALVDVVRDREAVARVQSTAPEVEQRAKKTERQLEGIQEKLVRAHGEILDRLKNDPQTNTVYREGILGPIKILLWAFHPVWFDGENTLWMLGEKKMHGTQSNACTGDWRAATRGDLMQREGNRYMFELLGSTVIAQYTGSGFSVWTNERKNPHTYLYNGKGRGAYGNWDVYSPSRHPTLGVAMRLARLPHENYPYGREYDERGNFYELMDLDANLFVLCLTTASLE